MNKQPACGCPVPVINPPDFGMAERVPGSCGEFPVPVPLPFDPSHRFPRVLTASADTRQSTSLACEPPSGCGCAGTCLCRGSMATATTYARYANEGLNLAEREIAALMARVHYPIPGIWIGPAYIHLPSGNVVFQFSAPPSGPLDPIPVFTINSLAGRDKGDFGYGVADLFNPTIQWMGGEYANIITGTGRYLVYSGANLGEWANAVASSRNALKHNTDLTWLEVQPDGLQWHYHKGGCLNKIVSPSGKEWTVSRSGTTTTITAPNGRVTTYSPSKITQPGSVITHLTIIDDLLTHVTYPNNGKIAFGYGRHNVLTSVTDLEGHTTNYEYDLL